MFLLKMMRIIRYVLAVLAMLVVVACVLLAVLDVAYMLHGSLEEFPTEDDQAEVREATVFMLFVIVVVGGLSGAGAWTLWPKKRTEAEQ